MSNGTKPRPLSPEEYGALVGGNLATQAAAGMYRDPARERSGLAPFETLGKYDEGATAALYQPQFNADPREIQEYFRGDNQKGWQKLGNAALAFIPGTALKVAQGFGHVGGAVASLLPGVDISAAYDNAFVNAISEVDEGLRNKLPIHMQKQYAEGNLIAKMGTAEFYAKDLADGVEFMASAMVPSGVFGKVGSLTKAVGKGSALGKALAKTSQVTGATASNVLATTYNTVSEAFFEAKDANDSYREAKAKYLGYDSYEALPEVEKQKVAQEAGDAAARTFWTNTATLAIPNFFESKWAQSILGKESTGAMGEVRRQILSGEKKAEDIAKGVGARKAAFKGMMTEGLWEENMQAAIQQYEQRLATGELDPESTSRIGEYAHGLLRNAWGFARVVPDILTLGSLGTSAKAGTLQDEGATSILLGGILGGGMSIWAAHKENKALAKYAKDTESLWGTTLDLKKLSDRHFVDNVASIYNQFGTVKKDDIDIPNWVNPKTGEREYNVDALMRKAVSDYRNVAYFNEGSMADAANDPIHGQFNLDMSLASWVYNLRSKGLSHGAIEDLMEHRSEIEENVEGTQVLARNKDKILAYSKSFDKASSDTSDINDFTDDVDSAAFKKILKRMNYYAGIKGTILSNLQVSPKAQKQVASLIEDNDALLTTLKNNKKQLKADYLAAVQPITELRKEQAKLLEEATKAKSDAVKSEEIGRKIASLEYTINEAKKLDGLFEDIELDSIYTEKLRAGMEPRNTKSPDTFPLRRNRFYNYGKEVLIKHKLRADLDMVAAAEDPIKAIGESIASLSSHRAFTGQAKAELTAMEDILVDEEAKASERLVEAEKEIAKSLVSGKDVSSEKVEVAELKAKLATLSPVQDAITALLQTPVSDQKYASPNPAITDIEDQAKYDYYKGVANKFATALRKARDPEQLEKFEDPQLIKDVREQANLVKSVFETRQDISPELRKRVLDEVAEVEKVLPALVAAQTRNANSRAAIQEAASREIGAQVQTIVEMPKVQDFLKEVFGDAWATLPETLSLGSVTGLIAAIQAKTAGSPQQGEFKTLLEGISTSILQEVQQLLNLKKDHAIIQRLAISPTKFIPWTTNGSIIPVSKRTGEDITKEVAIFTETKNLTEFWAAMERTNYKGFSEEETAKLKSWKELADKLMGIEIIRSTLGSDTKILDQLKIEQEAYKERTANKAAEDVITPTMQQINAVRRAIAFLTQDTGKGVNNNLLFIEGLAGTGKTKVVVGTIINVYNKLTGNSIDNVYTIAHTATSSEIIHEQVKGEKAGHTTPETFLKADLSEIKILVIDEAPAFSDARMRKVLSKVANYNKTAAEPIKVLALGDPAQITEKDHPEINSAKRTSVTTVMPLTATYRTNVGPILDFMSIFRLQPKSVMEIHTEANTDISAMASTENLVGTTGSMDSDRMLNTAARASNTSKLVVVTTEEAKRTYEAELRKRGATNTEVAVYTEIGGTQVDEVYIDLDKGIKRFSQSEMAYNKAMFTAASRAIKFVYAMSPYIHQSTSPELEVQTAVMSEDLLANAETYVTSLEETTDTVNGLLGTKIKKMPKPKKKKTKKEKEAEIAEEEARQAAGEGEAIAKQEMAGETLTPPGVDQATQDTITAEKTPEPTPEIVPEEATDGGIIDKTPPPPPANTSTADTISHNLAHPTNAMLAQERDPIEQGAEVRVLSIRRRGKEAIYAVYAKTTTEKWKEIGVLGQKDFDEDTDGRLLEVIATEPTTMENYRPLERRHTRKVISPSQEELNNATLITGTLDSFAPLKYYYDKSTRITKNALGAALTTFFKGVAPQLTKEFKHKNNQWNWKKLSKYVQVGVFNQQKRAPNDPFTMGQALAEKERKYGAGFTPIPGIPYMVIKLDNDDFAEKTQGSGIPTQYIRLQRNSLTRDHKYYKVLSEYREAYTALEEITEVTPGSKEFSDLIHITAQYFHVERTVGTKPILARDPNKSSSNLLAEIKKAFPALQGLDNPKLISILETLVHLTYGPDWRTVKFPDRSAAQAFVEAHPKGEYKIDSEYKDSEGRVAIVEVLSENTVKSYKDWVVNAQAGPAQTAFSALAVANPEIAGKTVRVEKRFNNNRIIVGKSLITAKSSTAEFLSRFRAMYKAEVPRINAWFAENRPDMEWVDKVKLSSRVSIDDYIAGLDWAYEISNGVVGIPASEVEDLRKKHSHSPITSDVIDAILDFDPKQKENLAIELPIQRRSGTAKNIQKKTGLNDYGEDLSQKKNRDGVQKQTHSNLTAVQSSNVRVTFNISSVAKPTAPPIPLTEETPAETQTGREAFRTSTLEEKFRFLETISSVLSTANREFLELTKEALDSGEATREEASEALEEIYKGYAESRGINFEIEDPETLSLITIEQAKTLVRTIVPGMPLDGDKTAIKFVSKFLLQKFATTPNSIVLGRTLDTGKILAGTDNGKVYEHALLHELLHYVYRNLMTPRERKQFNASAIRKYGKRFKNMSQDAREDFLANKWAAWHRNPEPPTKTFVDRMLHSIKQFLQLIGLYRKDIEFFFKNVSAGKYAQERFRPWTGDGINMSYIVKNFGSINSYRVVRKYIVDRLSHYKKFGNNDLPVSRDESYLLVKDDIKKEVFTKGAEIDDYLGQVEGIQQYYDFTTETTTPAYKKLSFAEKRRVNGIYNNIYKSALPKAREQYNAFSKTLGTNDVTRGAIFFDIIKAIYPNWSARSDASLAKKAADSAIQDELMKANRVSETSQNSLREQIVDSENVDARRKLSDSVKDFLSFITYEKDGQVKEVSSSFAFLKMLETFLDLHFTGATTDDIYDQVETLINSGVHTDGSAAILDSLLYDVIEPAITDRTAGKNIAIVTHNLPGSKVTSYHLVYYDAGESIVKGESTVDLSKITTLEDAESLSRENNLIKVVSLPKGNIYLHKLYEAGLREGAPIDSREHFTELYRRVEARNLLSEMQTLFGSQKQTNLMIASVKSDYGDTKVSYINAKDLGIRVNIKREIQAQIAELHQDLLDKGQTNGFKQFPYLGAGKTIMNNLKVTSSNESKMLGLEAFFDQLNLKAYYIASEETKDLAPLATTVRKLILDLATVGSTIQVPKVKEDGKPVEGETVDHVLTIEEILEQQGARLNTISIFLSKGTELLRASSIKDSEGKPIYKYNNSHYQFDTLNILSKIASPHFKGAVNGRKIFAKFLPEFIRTRYFQENIFTKGIGKLHSGLNYHDAIRMEKTGYVKPMSRENPEDRYTREFLAGFAATIQNTKNKYYQFFYPPSHRGKVMNIQVKALTPEEIKASIKAAITQFATTHASFGNTKNFKELDFTNFLALRDVLADNPDIDFRAAAKNPDALVDLVYNKISEYALETAEDMVTQKVRMPSNLNTILSAAESYIDKAAVKKLNSKAKFELPTKIKSVKWNKQTKSNDYIITVEDILPLVHAYTMNNYINGFFVNQLVLGDNRFYNEGSDVVKRNAGTSAAGQIGLAGFLHGLPKRFRMGIVKDKTISSEHITDFLDNFLDPKDAAEVRKYYEDSDVDITDAQGFMTPNRWRDIQRGFGRAYGLANVMKPVHFQNRTEWVKYPAADNMSKAEVKELLKNPAFREKDGLIQEVITTPIYVKYSSIVITNELAKKFPKLGAIRYQMERQSLDELVFASAIKVGLPTEMAEVDDFITDNDALAAEVELDNAHYRMQLNPYTDVDTHVSIYSQLMYFFNILGTNNEQADTIYKTVSALIELGLIDAENLINSPDELDVGVTSPVKAFILKALKSGDSQRARELIEADVDINNPVIEQKAITAIASGIEKLTTKIKFKGSKMVLQSAYGLENFGDIQNITAETIAQGRNLEYRVDPTTNRMYAEVIFPAKYLTPKQIAAIKAGQSVFLTEDMFGFRIPSTELHSAVPLRIVETYDDAGTNVIIAPRELVPLHGSDFDVDSLFVVMRESVERDTTLVAFPGVKEITYLKGEYIGYGAERPGRVEIALIELDALDDYIHAANRHLLVEDNPKVKASIRTANRLRKIFLRNYITENVMETITNERNRPRMLTPISMKEPKQLIDDLDLGSKENLDLNHPVQRQKAFELIQHGQTLVGAFANDVKSMAYMLRAGSDLELNVLKEELRATQAQLNKKIGVSRAQRIQLRAKRDDLKSRIRIHEDTASNQVPRTNEDVHFDFEVNREVHTLDHLRELDTNGAQTWQRLDSAINAAVDNIKELILPRLGVTTFTGKAFSGLLSVGLPLKQIVQLINHPVVKLMQTADYKNKPVDAVSQLNSQIEEILKGRKELVEARTLSDNDLTTALPIEDLKKLPTEELIKLYSILDVFRKGHRIGKSLSDLAGFLNIVRELPTSAEEIENVYNKYKQVFNVNSSFEESLEISDSLQLSGKVAEYISKTGESIGDTDVTTIGGFSFHIDNFFKVNPHIFSSWKAVLKLRNIIQKNFILHSKEVINIIDELGMTNIRLDKGMADSSTGKNNVLHRRELSKYLMTQTYVKKLQAEKPFKYKDSYDNEKILYQGSAFSQRFAKKLFTLKRWNKGQIVNNPDYMGNTFLQNLSISRSPFTGLYSIRFSKGTSLDQSEIEEIQADFERLAEVEVVGNKVQRVPDNRRVLKGEYSPLQNDFVKYSVLNFGFRFSAANYAQVLPPAIYHQLDVNMSEEWGNVLANDGADVKEHFKVSLAAHHADKLSSIPSYKAEAVANGTQMIEVGGKFQEENNYVGQEETAEGTIFYDRKYPINKFDAPKFMRTGEGRKATAYIRVWETPKLETKGPQKRFAYYQRLGVPIDGMYHAYPKEFEYEIKDHFNPFAKTLRVPDKDATTFTIPYDMPGMVGESLFIVDKNDYTRANATEVIIESITAQRDGTFKVKVRPTETREITGLADAGGKSVGSIQINPSKVSTVKDTLSSLEKRFKDNKVFQSIKSRLKDFPDIQTLPIYKDVKFAKAANGFYTTDNGGGIYISKDAPDKEKTLLHEITHAYTATLSTVADMLRETPAEKYYATREFYIKKYNLTKTEQDFIYDITSAYYTAKFEIDEVHYGLTNIPEFIAEASSNPTFRAALSRISPISETSIWQRIVKAFRDLFGLSGTRNLLTHTEDLISDYIQYRTANKFSNEFFEAYSVADTADTPSDSLREESDKFTEETHPTTKRSVYKKGEKFYKRVSDILNMFKHVFSEEEWYDKAAENRWSGRSPETILKTEEGELNQEEYRDALEQRHVRGTSRGKVIHAMLQAIIHPEKLGEIRQSINNYLTLGGINPAHLKWVEEYAPKIFKSVGVNIFDEGVTEDQKDKVMSEVTVGNDLLEVAGTADLMVKHADGTYSMIDFKTGFNFHKPSTYLLKYFSGDGRDITASSRDVAGLQLAWYAFLFRLENPDIRFRSLRVRWIPSEFHIDSVDHKELVDMDSYLPIIQQFLSREPGYKEVWEKIQARDDFKALFSPSTYFSSYSPKVIADIENNKYSPEQQAALYLQKLKELTQYRIVSVDRDDDPKFIDKRIQELTSRLVELLGDEDIDYNAVKTGSTYFDEWIGNMYDSTDPHIKLAVRFFEERKQRAEVRYDTSYKGLLARLTPVYKSYQKRNNLAVADKIPIFKGKLNFTNYKDLYSPMYKNSKDGDVIVREWNSTKEDWAKAAEDYGLSPQEVKEYKALTEYIKDQYSQFYIDKKSSYTDPNGKSVSLWNRAATQRWFGDKKITVTNGEIFNGATRGGKKFSANARSNPYEYDANSLIPMVPITGEEIHREYGFMSKEYRDYLKERYATMHVEEHFEQWYNDDTALPFKYIPNEFTQASGNYSLNVELQFDKFMRNMIFKEELDDVYALYKGLQWSLEAKDKLSNGAPAFAGSAELLKINASMQIQGRSQREFKSRLFKRGVNKDWIKILGTFQQVTAAPIMWLKPVTGTANGVFTYMYTIKEGIKGSVIKKLEGIDNSVADFTTADIAWATAQYLDMQKDAIAGNLRQNKMFLFLKRFNYLPDTYKWATESNQLLTQRNKLVSQSAMYMFHTLPEEAVAAMIMAAQLRNMKIHKSHETHRERSLWSMYTPQEFTNPDGTKFWDLVWEKDDDGKAVVRGYINTSKDPNKPVYKELTELTSREIQRLRYVYQRMHGGYRPDERTKLEYFIIGKLFMQFKKYLPTLLRNATQEKGVSDSLGYYKQLDMKDGAPIVKWQQEIIEGRWRVLLKSIISFMTLNQEIDQPTNSLQRALNILRPSWQQDYKWKNMSGQQKAAALDGVISLLTMAMLSVGYIQIFGSGAGDSEDSWARIMDRVFNDYSQQYNLLELMKNTLNNLSPVSGRKLYKTSEALTQFIGSLVLDNKTQEGNYRGLSELKRSIPFISSYRDLQYFLENRKQDSLTDYIFSRGIN